jgi:hypothetical protein
MVEILYAVLEHEFDDVEIDASQNDFSIKVSGGYLDEDSAEFLIEQNTQAVATFLNNITTADDRYNRFDIRKLEIKLAIDLH